MHGSHHLEHVLVQLLHIEDTHLLQVAATDTQAPEQLRDGQVNLTIVRNCLRNYLTAESERLVHFLYHALVLLLTNGSRVQAVVFCQLPHLDCAALFLVAARRNCYRPFAELVGNVVVEFERGAETRASFTIELELKEATLVNLAHDMMARLDEVLALDLHLLPLNLLELLSVIFDLAALVQVLL